MFDMDNDMFKPIIGARLIREEWKRSQTEIEGIEESQAGIGTTPELGGEAMIQGTGIETLGLESATTIPGTEALNHTPKGGSKEVR